MILGVYWYFDFPLGLYSFDYFEFHQGFGGHANNPAVLSTTVAADNPENILEQLKALVTKYSEAFLFVYRDDNLLKIGTGHYQLFDYDFLFIKEVEKMLTNEKVQPDNGAKLSNSKVLRLENNHKDFVYPSMNYFQVVGSPLRKYNAETKALRLDCNIETGSKAGFLDEMEAVTDSANVDVLYYLENEFHNSTNLMLLLTNGRQGLNLQEKKIVDVKFLEEQTEGLFKKYNIQSGHKGGYENYAQNKCIVRKIVDREFILGDQPI